MGDWDFHCPECGRGYMCRPSPEPQLGLNTLFCRSCNTDLTTINDRTWTKLSVLPAAAHAKDSE